jgi:predicted PhzF superfamily epimerase YddE/YHI9
MPGATWRLRSFTPIGAEVYGAGHNALGAWLWLAGSGRLASGQDGSPSRSDRRCFRCAWTAPGNARWCRWTSRHRCSLAALLVRSGAAAEGTVVIEQGRALGRPSRIQVSVTGDQVTVSGSGLVVADGTILLE